MEIISNANHRITHREKERERGIDKAQGRVRCVKGNLRNQIKVSKSPIALHLYWLHTDLSSLHEPPRETKKMLIVTRYEAQPLKHFLCNLILLASLLFRANQRL